MIMTVTELCSAIIGAAALVVALSAIWVKGIKPSAQWVGELVATLRRLADLLEDMKDFLLVEREHIRHEIRELRIDVDELTLAVMADPVTLHAPTVASEAHAAAQAPSAMSEGARA